MDRVVSSERAQKKSNRRSQSVPKSVGSRGGVKKVKNHTGRESRLPTEFAVGETTRAQPFSRANVHLELSKESDRSPTAPLVVLTSSGADAHGK